MRAIGTAGAMPRSRGVGMARPKKKTVVSEEMPGPTEMDTAPADDEPNTSTSGEAPAPVPKAPISPALQARREANAKLRRVLKSQKWANKMILRAKQIKLLTMKISSEMCDHIERMQKKKRRDHYKELQLIHKVELFDLKEAAYFQKSVDVYCRVELSVAHAQIVCKDLDIARLREQLRLAKKR